MTEPGLDRVSIRRSLDELGVRPSKRLGQNFLSSPSAARLIAEEATRGAPACIVEIGPGLGSITRFLAETPIPVVAVEVDRRLAEYLTREFTGSPSVEIRADDALEVDLRTIAAAHGESLTIVGSIPYSITAPILKWIISQCAAIRSAVLVTQREVAEKIAASPGKDGSSLGVYVQAYADVEVLQRIPRGAFFPVPDVDSTLWSLRFGRPRRFEASEA
ncbi:MAG: rRNA adenine dimethyltransferase family protein, partial [Candidatus Bipolaricaulota bacterium]|nr:rRNA adenine dimethyltransferase family protein [Candidatus Bipolaricaulota bacterium]